MVRQRSRLGRALRNDRRVYAPVRDALSAAPPPPVFRTHHNARYGNGELVAGMARAAATNRTLASSARRLRRVMGGSHPTPEWHRERPAAAEDGQAAGILAASARAQLAALAARGAVRRACRIAVDMHDIGRWDRRPGPCLVRSREKNGTRSFERVMTAQCAGDAPRITLATGPVGALDDVPRVLRRTTRTVKRALAGTGALPVLLMDRGFPSAGTLRVLREERVACRMPMRRTGNVVDATAGHAAGTRGRVSTVAMESGGACEHHTAVIVPRRDARKRRGDPWERLMVFAVSAPWAGVEWHGMRWVIESWYREPGRARIRTATTNPAGRALCLAYSLIMPSAWAVAMAMAALASRHAAAGLPRITHSGFCDVAEDMAEQGLLLPEPPPGPP